MQEAPGRTGASARPLCLPLPVSVSAHLQRAHSVREVEELAAHNWARRAWQGEGARVPRLPLCFPGSALTLGDRVSTHGQTWGCCCCYCLGTHNEAQAPASPSGGQGAGGCPVPWRVQTPPPCCPQQQDLEPFSQRAGARGCWNRCLVLGCGRPRTWLAHICWEAPADTDAAGVTPSPLGRSSRVRVAMQSDPGGPLRRRPQPA